MGAGGGKEVTVNGRWLPGPMAAGSHQMPELWLPEPPAIADDLAAYRRA